MKITNLILILSLFIISSFIYTYHKNESRNTLIPSHDAINQNENSISRYSYRKDSSLTPLTVNDGSMNIQSLFLPGPTNDSIILDTTVVYDTIAENFVGFSFEKDNLFEPGFFQNKGLVNLLANFYHPGFIRLGGASNDSIIWHTDTNAGDRSYFPFVLEKDTVSIFNRFLDSIDYHDNSSGFWKVIWALPVYPYRNRSAYIKDVRKEATDVVDSLTSSKLMTFTAGNEPNTYPPGFVYNDFYNIYKTYWDTLAAYLPSNTFMSGPASTRGPAFDSIQLYFKKFADSSVNNTGGATEAQLFDIHNYHFHADDPNTADFDSANDLIKKKVFDSLNLWIDSMDNHVGGKPWRIDEGNVIGGLDANKLDSPATSFGSALWALNNMWILASRGCSGWAAHTSANLNPSFPIGYDVNASQNFFPRPVYYAMLEFQQGVYGTPSSTYPGILIKNTTRFYTSGAQMYVYSCKESSGKYMVTIINTGPDISNLRVSCAQGTPTTAYSVALTPQAGSTGNINYQFAYIGGQVVSTLTSDYDKLDYSAVINHPLTYIVGSGNGYFEVNIPKNTAVVVKMGY